MYQKIFESDLKSSNPICLEPLRTTVTQEVASSPPEADAPMAQSLVGHVPLPHETYGFAGFLVSILP